MATPLNVPVAALISGIPRRGLLATSSAALLGGLLGGSSGLSFAEPRNGVVAGAIRWDAWYSHRDFSVYAQNDLWPEKFHSRVPLHCKIGPTAIECVGSQDKMDEEILIATSSGIKFWAFVWFPPDSSLRVAWDLYQSSRIRDRIKWCGIVATDALRSKEVPREWAEHMAAPNYQKIVVDGVENRPLFFLLWHQNDIKNIFGGDIRNVAEVLRLLRERAMASGLGPPYTVVLDGVDGAQVGPVVGADAISSYISGFRREPAASYNRLDEQTRAYWTSLASTGAAMVPITMVGWDTRPRHETPGPWYRAATNPDHYYAMATPAELSEHVRAAVRFIRANPRACPSKVLLIYSWDECDEGGCLMPTYGDPTGSRLQAIAPVIK